MQGRDLSSGTSVLATPKHFAGDGDTMFDERPPRPTRASRPTSSVTIDQGVTVTNWRDFLRTTSPAVPRPPRGQRDAVVLERRLDRGRRRQPVKMHANRDLITGLLKGSSASTAS